MLVKVCLQFSLSLSSVSVFSRLKQKVWAACISIGWKEIGWKGMRDKGMLLNFPYNLVK